MLFYLNAPISDIEYFQECSEKFSYLFNSEGFKVDLAYPRDDEEMYSMYSSSDVFIFPNEKQTWGNAPLEAMASGSVAMVSSGCGISEIINEITPDLIFDVGDLEGMLNIIALLSNLENRNKNLQLQKSYVLKNLQWNSICKVYLEDFLILTRGLKSI